MGAPNGAVHAIYLLVRQYANWFQDPLILGSTYGVWNKADCIYSWDGHRNTPSGWNMPCPPTPWVPSLSSPYGLWSVELIIPQTNQQVIFKEQLRNVFQMSTPKHSPRLWLIPKHAHSSRFHAFIWHVKQCEAIFGMCVYKHVCANVNMRIYENILYDSIFRWRYIHTHLTTCTTCLCVYCLHLCLYIYTQMMLKKRETYEQK